jgi:hypothetical protein
VKKHVLFSKNPLLGISAMGRTVLNCFSFVFEKEFH